MKNQILKYYPQCEVLSIPVADGGEGSVDCFLTAMGGRRIEVEVTGPYFEKVTAFYGILPDEKTAVIEMAAAAGLPMVDGRRDARKTTTYGVGELMLHAVQNGCEKLIIGLGGSCTNDCACGAAAAAGIRFYNAKNETFVPVGGTLKEVARIDASGLDPLLRSCEIIAMCDIDNPMYGPHGAAYVFGPQKGANTPEIVKELDIGLRHISEKICDNLGQDLSETPGAGAAGAMGAGMVAFFGGSLKMGIEAVLDTVSFDTIAADADVIFTGEGRIDTQSLRGKVVIGVGKRAKRLHVPVIAVVGDIGDHIESAYDMGISAVVSTNRVAVPFEVAKPRSKSDMELTMDTILRLLCLAEKNKD